MDRYIMNVYITIIIIIIIIIIVIIIISLYRTFSLLKVRENNSIYVIRILTSVDFNVLISEI